MSDRLFPIKARGEFREAMLRNYRYGLRQATNPETQRPFDEEDIARATQVGSELYLHFDGLDALLLLQQQRAVFLAAQANLATASTESLKNLHAPLWGEVFLQAAGGSGLVNAPALSGTLFYGTTIIGDPSATVARDAAGLRYQVLYSEVTPPSEIALLTMVGIDTGDSTNLEPGTKLTWVNGPIGATAAPTVATKFRGGLPAETDAQFIKRLQRRIRHKQGAGNRAQLRAWAEDAANNAVESAFVYSCVFHAGSVALAIVQKRGSITGPAGRVASAGTLAAVTAQLVPPGSAVLPGHPRLVVLGAVPVASDLVIGLSQAQGSSAGWVDFQPWPSQLATITATNIGGNPLAFRLSTAGALPFGGIPRMMIWDVPTSRFEELSVASVSLQSGIVYDVVLTNLPTHALAVNDFCCPLNGARKVIAETVELFFDSLGPGELIDTSPTSIDSRRGRAFRFPKPNEEYPQRAGTTVLSFLQDALGTSLADSVLSSVSVALPPIPADPILGPGLLVAGRLGIYPL